MFFVIIPFNHFFFKIIFILHYYSMLFCKKFKKEQFKRILSSWKILCGRKIDIDRRTKWIWLNFFSTGYVARCSHYVLPKQTTARVTMKTLRNNNSWIESAPGRKSLETATIWVRVGEIVKSIQDWLFLSKSA